LEITTIIIILLLATVVSNLVDSLFPKLPLPLIQIAVGALLILTPLEGDIQLNPRVFMGFLVAPILFREAEEADLLALWRMRRQVIAMAFLLVFVTVVGVGFSVHALVSAIPLAACFALGAILGPTDAIAVNSLSGRISVDAGILSILKGEGLINDASGVISFHFAVAAMLGGTFAIGEASLDFLIECVGGLVCGLVIAVIKETVISRLRHMQIHSTSTFMIIELLMPFISYLAAESFGVSGIIAAVTAGTRSALKITRIEMFEAEFSLLKKSLWEMLMVTFNSLVFLLLGFQLPGVARAIIESSEYSLPFAIGVGALATFILLAVRFAGTILLASGAVANGIKNRLKNSFILTLSGVKGTVSLAVAFSLPYTISDGVIFEQRPLLLFVTATAIILSLLLAVIILPFVTPKREISKRNANHIMVINEVLNRLAQDDGEYVGAAIRMYKKRVKDLEHEDYGHKEKQQLRSLRGYIFRLESDLIDEQVTTGALSHHDASVYNKILHAMSYLQEKPTIGRLNMRYGELGKDLMDGDLASAGRELIAGEATGKRREREQQLEALKQMEAKKLQDIFWKNTSAVLEALDAMRDRYPDELIAEVVEERIELTGQIMEGVYGSAVRARMHDEYDTELVKAFELERKVVAQFYKEGKLDDASADQIRIDINTLESYTMEQRHSDDVIRALVKAQRKRQKAKERAEGKRGPRGGHGGDRHGHN
jgi:CPA1 family monovalent cation:H+ antiporter